MRLSVMVVVLASFWLFFTNKFEATAFICVLVGCTGEYIYFCGTTRQSKENRWVEDHDYVQDDMVLLLPNGMVIEINISKYQQQCVERLHVYHTKDLSEDFGGDIVKSEGLKKMHCPLF